MRKRRIDKNLSIRLQIEYNDYAASVTFANYGSKSSLEV